MQGVGVIRKLSKILSRNSFITIYKSFVRSHLDYGDVLYYQPNNESLFQKIESVQYNAALAITDATSSVKWSDRAHFLQSQGNFFCHFYVPFFYIFLTPKNYKLRL